MSGQPKKLILAVIDGLKPSMFERTVADGRAPALARLLGEGVYVDDCVAAFPSVTPTCAASIATGVGPAEHHIPSMNWWTREEERYVEYGSSFSASRQFGLMRSLTDTVYNMNLTHLSPEVPTLFERLEEADARTAGTTYLIYRGPHLHEVTNETALARLATSTWFRRSVHGPRELFYADLFASRRTGCRSQLGLPGLRDQHSGCVGSYLIEHDLFDFLLLSLPDNDTWSHKHGPHSQPVSITAADRQLERLMHAAGGPDAFLEEHAVIIAADHSHTLVEATMRLEEAFEEYTIAPATAARSGAGEAEIAVCPAQRSAMLYVLDPERREDLLPELIETALGLEGVDLVLHTHGGEAVIASAERGELHFAPGSDVADPRGQRWSVEGELGVLGGELQDGVLVTPDYPDALGRVWSALQCPTAGDLLLSAAPGWEFLDWGGQAHIGGGSHGSLHRGDSEGVLLWCGTGPADRTARPQWSIRDIAPLVYAHFGLPT